MSASHLRIAFRITLGAYHLALGTWFGATLMMGLAAGLTFNTLRAARPTLPEHPVVSLPEFAPMAAEYLAGNAVNRGFAALTMLQAVCAAAILVALVLHGTVFRGFLVRSGQTWANAVRVATAAGALALFASDLMLNRPPMNDLRQAMYDVHATAEQRDRARARFDDLHRRSERSMGLAGLLVVVTLGASPFAFRCDSPQARVGVV
jgi:hypothetical protein